MTIETKREIDEIVEVAPVMAMLTNPPCVAATAFKFAKKYAEEGDTEAALYLLQKHPDTDGLRALTDTDDTPNMLGELFGGMGL